MLGQLDALRIVSKARQLPELVLQMSGENDNDFKYYHLVAVEESGFQILENQEEIENPDDKFTLCCSSSPFNLRDIAELDCPRNDILNIYTVLAKETLFNFLTNYGYGTIIGRGYNTVFLEFVEMVLKKIYRKK